jgi:DHA2 family multidrug resistance protein-like MFS transporter
MVAVSAIVMSVTGGSIATVALPTIAATLAISQAASIWIVNAYQLAIVVTLFPMAALGEAHGYRRVFRGGLAVFTAASGVCALAPDFATLVAARTLQGFGAGCVMAVFAGVLRYTYPQRLLGLAIGINALFASLSSALAPTLGALLLTEAGWPWLFAVNLPIGLLALLASPALPVVAGSPRRISVLSAALNAGFLAGLILGIDQLSRMPLPAAGLLIAAALCLAGVLAREIGRPAPLIPLDLLRITAFRLAVMASACAFSSQIMGLVMVPFLLHGAGYAPLATGYLMMPWPLTVACAALFAGRLADRYSSAWPCAVGGALQAAGLVLVALWSSDQGPVPFAAAMVLGGLGFGLFQTPNNRTMLLTASRERSGAAGGMQATARQFGQSAGAALVALIFAASPAQPAPPVLVVAAALALLGGVLSFLRR